MSNETNPDSPNRWSHDPLFWLWIAAALSPVSTMILDLFGLIDRTTGPYPLVNNVSWMVFGAVMVACAIRGKDIGEDQPMSTGGRICVAVIGVAIAVVALVLGLLPALKG